MPLKLEIKKNLTARSERVKCVDLHPTEPWVLVAQYSGAMFVWNYDSQTMIKSFEVTDAQPIRCAKFVARKQWIVCGSDDMMIRVYNYNTMEKIKSFEAHPDYIRCLEVHPSQPYLLTCSDDMSIKLWDWEKDWEHTQTFEGHSHYVMMVKFNPKDTNTFASASLDRSIKVWSLGSVIPNFSLEGHDRGVNCIDYFLGGDKPYLVSGADDNTVRIWDYQSKSCVQTLEGHTDNVAAVVFHPRLPVIVSGSEDGTVRMWHNTTYRLETTLSYGMQRCWSLAVSQGTGKVALGYDEGTTVIMIGRDMPVLSMDSSTGKLLFATNNEISSGALRKIGDDVGDGDAIEVAQRELGACEIFPQSLKHNANGRFVAVCGDGEYIVYTAQALRNKSFGNGLDFVWSAVGTGDYAVRESPTCFKLFRNFKEEQSFKPPFSVEGIYGGHMVAVAGSGFLVFYDWETGTMVQRVDVDAKDLYWSDSGDMVVIACEESYFVLDCNRDGIANAVAAGDVGEDGVEGSFVMLHEISETVTTGQWVGDCFLYTNAAARLNYYVGGKVMTLAHLDRQLFLLGFIARENRVFLVDKQGTIVSYKIMEAILEYQTAVVRRDFDHANEILPTIPVEDHDEIARFLESQGFTEEALSVSRDPDQRFDLAFRLEKFEMALKIMREEIVPTQGVNTTDTQTKWKQLGDLALAKGNLDLAEACARDANDLGGLLLMYSSSGDADRLAELAQMATEARKTNVAFMAHLLLGDHQACVNVLQETGRVSEAAMFAHTYAPSLLEDAVAKWKESCVGVNDLIARALPLPESNPDMYPDFKASLDAEHALATRLNAAGREPAHVYEQAVKRLDVDLLEMVRSGALKPVTAAATAAAAVPEPTPVPAPVPVPVPEPVVREEVVVEEPTPVPAPEPVYVPEPEPVAVAPPVVEPEVVSVPEPVAVAPPVVSAPAPAPPMDETPEVMSVPLIPQSAPVPPAVAEEFSMPVMEAQPPASTPPEDDQMLEDMEAELADFDDGGFESAGNGDEGEGDLDDDLLLDEDDENWN